jgi:isopropylmalate/homocitrate/citramalate synthase
MVSEFNRDPAVVSGSFPEHVEIRDITLRTIEQMGVIASPEARLRILEALVSAGVPRVMVSAFNRGHTADEMRREADLAHSINSECKLTYGSVNTKADIDLAAETGYDEVQMWIGPYLGAATPAIAGAVYHRAWQGRDWKPLNFPKRAEDQVERVERIAEAAHEAGVLFSVVLALLTYARGPYIEMFSKGVAKAGASDFTFGDHSSSLSPEGWTHVARLAKSVAPDLKVAVHTHDMFGLATACALAGAKGGAEIIEVSVNALTEGPAQADIAETACSLEVLYGVKTGIELEKLTGLAQLVAEVTGEKVRRYQSLVGDEIFEIGATGDSYTQEFKIDDFFHASIAPAVVGNVRRLRISGTSGPYSLWDKLDELGIEASKSEVEQIFEHCHKAAMSRLDALPDELIAEIARSTIGASEHTS